jgi:hypothetical protein
MQRRELLQILGAAAFTPALTRFPAARQFEIGQSLHARLGTSALRVLTPEQDALVTRIAELIIPETDTPGATTVKVNEFIDLLLAEWYSDEDKTAFLNGLSAIDAEATLVNETIFVNCRPEAQSALLTKWDTATGDPTPGSATAGFKKLKNLTIYGYFTSERVTNEVVRPVIFHPAFEGCIPFTPGVRR